MFAVYFIDVSCHASECPSSAYPYGMSKRRSVLFFGESWPACYAAARAEGWLLQECDQDKVKCLCPACVASLIAGAGGRTVH
ncbi:hypothetical protein [Duganella callida]|uniref:Uncharacterized protein n=1 Tax=Duganella callida TaxID=2561932 RepID=A0A4Y9SNA2_9BURK|nr:hypothetical protein [Duganella callida]TFW28150.1 hypothetical protein E4L98_05900 [Duganella callida]